MPTIVRRYVFHIEVGGKITEFKEQDIVKLVTTEYGQEECITGRVVMIHDNNIELDISQVYEACRKTLSANNIVSIEVITDKVCGRGK